MSTKTLKQNNLFGLTSDSFDVKTRIQLGSYYTPQYLVDKAYDMLGDLVYKKDAVIFDSAAGDGAFVQTNRNLNYLVADCDEKAVNSLKETLPKNKVFFSNSLENVSRLKYGIKDDVFLIQIGNPPYNDTTSEFKNGEKGKNICDIDLFDRDLGVSFLKSYNKLQSNIVCVLHPLSYLIKESNFKRLKEFRENYRLVESIVFSSEWFPGTGSVKFPIVIAVYERNPLGMSFEYIRNFEFAILGKNNKFKLSDYQTTDGFIHKYPPRKNDKKESPLNLYYYTFRDINSLKRNTSFMDKYHYNGIVVTLENFYKYAYLFCFKKLFDKKDPWLYGNLSPLVKVDTLEKNKEIFVRYALANDEVLKRISLDKRAKLEKFYNLNSSLGDDFRTPVYKIISGIF